MLCEHCNKEHDGTFATGRFCSIACSAAFSTSKRRKEISEKVSVTTTRKKRLCKTCGELASYRQGGTGLYCSIHKGLSPSEIPFEELKKDSTRKKRLIEEKGHICWDCGRNTWLGRPIPLQLDHIDGNPDSNDRSNLRVICPNCHATTPTFAGRNKGSIGGEQRKSKRSKYYKYVNQN